MWIVIIISIHAPLSVGMVEALTNLPPAAAAAAAAA